MADFAYDRIDKIERLFSQIGVLVGVNGVPIIATGDIVTFAVGAKLIKRNSLPVDPPERYR